MTISWWRSRWWCYNDRHHILTILTIVQHLPINNILVSRWHVSHREASVDGGGEHHQQSLSWLFHDYFMIISWLFTFISRLFHDFQDTMITWYISWEHELTNCFLIRSQESKNLEKNSSWIGFKDRGLEDCGHHDHDNNDHDNDVNDLTMMMTSQWWSWLNHCWSKKPGKAGILGPPVNLKPTR